MMEKLTSRDYNVLQNYEDMKIECLGNFGVVIHAENYHITGYASCHDFELVCKR